MSTLRGRVRPGSVTGFLGRSAGTVIRMERPQSCATGSDYEDRTAATRLITTHGLSNYLFRSQLTGTKDALQTASEHLAPHQEVSSHTSELRVNVSCRILES